MAKPIGLLAGAVVVLAGCAATTEEPGVTIERLVVLADGDHVASTYVDGLLAPADAGYRDQLITVSIVDGQVNTASVDVPNSVTAAPEVVATTPDGRTAFVAERLAQRRPGDTRADQLAPGTTLSAVDVSDRGAPQVITSTVVAESPEAIAVSPDGTTVAVVANPPTGAVVELHGWDGASFSTSTRATLTDVDLATNVHWRPTGDVVAVNDDRGDQVHFYTVENDSDTTVLVPLGAPVDVGTDPFVGRFTPDGRHYLTANWGRDLTTTVAADRLPEEPSTISVIDVQTRRVVGGAIADVSSEGLAVSPDGTLVATVNMRGTVFQPGSPKYDELASVSLFTLGEDGALTKVGDTALTAVLPEGGTFDPSGQYFVATSFQGRDGGDGGSGLEIFRVDRQVGLVPVQRVSLPHGVHHVVAG